MRHVAILVLLVGCSRYFGGDDEAKPDPIPPDAAVEPPPDAPVQPSGATCPADVSLALAGTMYAQVPITLDQAGTTLCIRLDTTAMTHPTYFDAQTPQEAGPPSSFGITLYDAEDHLLAAGYDAQLPSMQTYATVSYSPMTKGILYVKVHAWARQGTHATRLDLSLYQILD